MKIRVHLWLTLAVFGVAACDGNTEPNGPGTLTASVVSPNGPEGAAILEVVGAVDAVTGTSDVQAFSTVTATGRRVILVRTTPGPLNVRIGVADVSRPPQISIVEVADGDDKLRASLNGYRVELD